MDGGKKVWVPDAQMGFKLGRIVDIGTDQISVEPFDAPGRVRIKKKFLFKLKIVLTFI